MAERSYGFLKQSVGRGKERRPKILFSEKKNISDPNPNKNLKRNTFSRYKFSTIATVMERENFVEPSKFCFRIKYKFIFILNRKCAPIHSSDWTHRQQRCHPANFQILTAKVTPACWPRLDHLVKCQDFSSASLRRNKTSTQATVGCSSKYSVTKQLRSCVGE